MKYIQLRYCSWADWWRPNCLC